MFNSDKLRGKMAEKRCTAEKMANFLGIDPATFYRKITGKTEFTRSEIQGVATLLVLSMQDLEDIFFADKLA
jgi:hypothetical protein